MMDLEEQFIPGLPSDVALQCLVRVSHKSHPEMQRVCRDWEALIGSRDFYAARKRSRCTSPAIVVVQALPRSSEPLQGNKQGTVPSVGLNLYDPIARRWEKIPPIPELGDCIPLFCQIVSVEGRLFVIGGWNPSSYEAMKSVFCFDFSTNSWRRCADMITARSFFACAAAKGCIVVAGGHDENKNALRSAERYDVAQDRWSAMADLGQERDECRGISLCDGSFAVVSGYGTNSQGEFSSSGEVWDESSASWRQVEGFGESPVICTGASGDLFTFRANGEVWRGNLGETGAEFCAKKVGQVITPGRVVAACSGPDGSKLEMVILVQDQSGVCRGLGFRPQCKEQWEGIENGGDEFSGIVQAACAVEI